MMMVVVCQRAQHKFKDYLATAKPVNTEFAASGL